MPPPIENDKDLSTDAKNLLRLAQAISAGSVPVDLANIQLGPIHHARWLTKAARILRLYVTTNSPSNNLRDLAIYVIKVYTPMYFNIKYYNSIIYGSVLLFKFIQWSKYLPDTQRNIVRKAISNNSYYAHSENVLLSMLFDDRKAIRDIAFNKILRIKIFEEQTELRAYTRPHINFDCTDYVNMIDLNDPNEVFEPPFTKKFTIQHLMDYKDSDEVMFVDPKIPCHIQNTERNVKEVTGAAKHVTTE